MGKYKKLKETIERHEDLLKILLTDKYKGKIGTAISGGELCKFKIEEVMFLIDGTLYLGGMRLPDEDFVGVFMDKSVCFNIKECVITNK